MKEYKNKILSILNVSNIYREREKEREQVREIEILKYFRLQELKKIHINSVFLFHIILTL